MDANTRQRYLAWRRRRVLKRVGLPALILATLIFGFIWGRRSVTIPECEEVICPPPVVCETPEPPEENDDYTDEDENDAEENPATNTGEDDEEDGQVWDQP